MRIAICDDQHQHINMLEKHFDRQKEFKIEVEPFENGEILVDTYNKGNGQFDAIFIDIEMKGLNGIEAANAIRAVDERVSIVFVTSHEEYAIDCFQCSPLRFLKKPLQPEKIDEALRAVNHVMTQKRATISFYENKNYVRLYCTDILYCEGSRNKVILHTVEGKHHVHMTLVEVEKILTPGMFCRCHKGFLVNLEHIKKIVGQGIELYRCENMLPIGRTYKQALKAAVVDYEEGMFR